MKPIDIDGDHSKPFSPNRYRIPNEGQDRYEKYDGQFIKNGALITRRQHTPINHRIYMGTMVIQPALKLGDFSPHHRT